MCEELGLLLKDAGLTLKNLDLKELNNKKILITGASGLLGINFLSCLKYLNLLGNKFTVHATIYSEPESYFNELMNYRLCDKDNKIFKGDLTDLDFCNQLDSDYDYIIHSATYGQPAKFLKDSIKTITLNTTITNLLLNKLNKDGKFLFISSSEIYSGCENSKHKESDIGTTNTNHNRACYIESKRCGEAIINEYRKNGYNVKSARLCLGYGIGVKLNDNRVLNEFIKKALLNNEIKLLDDGSSIRQYGYITDIIEIMWNILLNGKENVYNVTGESIISIQGLAKIIGEIANVQVTIPVNNDSKITSAPSQVLLNIDRVKREFNKYDFVDIKDGLKKVIEWHKLIISKQKDSI